MAKLSPQQFCQMNHLGVLGSVNCFCGCSWALLILIEFQPEVIGILTYTLAKLQVIHGLGVNKYMLIASLNL